MPPREFISHVMFGINDDRPAIPIKDGDVVEDEQYEIKFLSSWWYKQKRILEKTYLDLVTNVYYLVATKKVKRTKDLLKNV